MPPLRCPTCGEKILLGECLYCLPEAAAAPAPPAERVPRVTTSPVPSPVSASPAPLPKAESADGPETKATEPPAPAASPMMPHASPASAPTTPPVPAPASTRPAGAAPAPSAPLDDRAYGLILFDAEEALARGQADKALVHASRAVHERPQDLIARGLFDRARRETLRGRRRDKLDSKVQEASGLFDRGEFAAAEKIVGSALKLVPDHDQALALFARLKDRRLQAPTAEAEAERELDRLARTQAHRDAESARAALRAGWDFRAALTLRRALLLVPGDRELLDLLAQSTGSLEATQAERRRKRTLDGQVRRALDLLGDGELEQSRNLLRAVLKEEPGHARAQAAIQQLRMAWLLREGSTPLPVGPPASSLPSGPLSASEAPARPAAAPTAARPPALQPAARPTALPPAARPAAVPPASRPTARPPTPRPTAVAATPSPTLPTPSRLERPLRPAAPGRATTPSGPVSPGIPPEILLPRSRRVYTPWKWIATGAAFVLALLFLLSRGPSSENATPRQLPPPVSAMPPPTTQPMPDIGPLAQADPILRSSIESALAEYAAALEAVDAARLAAARPDLSDAEREALLQPFRGALNVATDVRVLDLLRRGEDFEVPVLRRDVIVGGRGGEGGAVEEVLRFTRRGSAWVLKPRP